MNWQYISLPTVDSTNRYARAIAATEVVVVADYQTCGRGQGSNRWESAAGKNLLFSIKLSPAGVLAATQFVLSMAGALAIKAALDAFAEGFTLKWPNDIFFHDRKISGTLIETTLVGKSVSECIFGVGVNVNQRSFATAPLATSLWQITHAESDRAALLTAILQHFDHYYALVAQGDYEQVYEMYNASLYRRGCWAPYADRDGTFEGLLSHVAPNGRLLVRDRRGRERIYESKELTFIIT